MGLSEFENEMKHRLEERTIVPSESAWDKLAGQLDGKPAKRSYAVYYRVAAILIIALIASAAFLIEKPEGAVEVVGTDTDRDKPELIEEVKPEVHKVLEKPVKQEYVETKPETFKKAPVAPVVDKSKIKDATEKSNHQPAPRVAETVVTKVQEVSPEDKKVNEIVNALASMQDQGTVITDAMVDSLLVNAQRDLAKEKSKAIIALPGNKKVDAMAQALLEEVEYDLDRSFKDKVFDALQGSLIKVRTAVVERNQ